MSQWELLVTEGHVRAARWRKALPVLLGAAIGTIVLGAVLARSLPESQSSHRVYDAKATFAAAQRNAVSAFLQNNAEAIANLPSQTEEALTPDDLQMSLVAALENLNQNESLPAAVTVENAENFWQANWPANTIHAVEDGRTILVGAYVNVAYQVPGYNAPPELRRSFWIFRRPEASWIWRDRDGPGWTYQCLAVPGAQPCGENAVDPAAIPNTMSGLLPSQAFEVQP
ncbi:hypothetical protein [Parerythrobacter lacustris]|uniref:DUF2939 domain-containing protein n=1 Tax=Parerythrobacter lacustris TaxID=2969984 RepID=A0ABT1XPK1_9SPHN|nr:hypothetical protein [Parerythrobacter lacustris]MCR2832397.1 hypothetical protein [Parerythrobacter lacustris]